MRLYLLLALVSFTPAILSQEMVAFYFAAHEDDWQLFMNPNASDQQGLLPELHNGKTG